MKADVFYMGDRFVDGYQCSECSWSAGAYEGPLLYGVRGPTFALQSCCPKCGASNDKIKSVSGRYRYRKIKRILFGSKTVIDKFIPDEKNGKDAAKI